MQVFNLYVSGCSDYLGCYARPGLSLPTVTLDLAIVLAMFNRVVSNIMQIET